MNFYKIYLESNNECSIITKCFKSSKEVKAYKQDNKDSIIKMVDITDSVKEEFKSFTTDCFNNEDENHFSYYPFMYEIIENI